MAKINSRAVTTSSGKKTLVKVGSKAEAKYKSQGASFSNSSSDKDAARSAVKSRSSALEAADPLSQAENAGVKIPDRIEADEMAGVVAGLEKKGIVPTQVTNNAQVQPPTAPNQPQDTIKDPVTGNQYSKGANGLYSPYQEGFQNAISSGAPAPVTAGTAAVSQYMPPAPADTAAVDSVFSDDPVVNQLMQGAWQMLNPVKQASTLMQDYKRLKKDSGLDDINEELIDAETVINGTEDDIRNEIQTAGGFGTESQVQSMALARNKSLLTRYNQLAQMKTDAQNQLNTMMTLSQQDRQMAQERINTQVSAMFNMANFRQQAQNNIKEQYRWLTTTMGADGIYDAYKNDPRQLAFLEKTIGVAPGGLQSLATKAAQDRSLEIQGKQAQINASRAATAASYASIADKQLESREAAVKAATKLDMRVNKAKTVTGKVGEALNQVSGGTTGFLGGVGRYVPGTKAYNLDKTIQTIKANIGFDELQAMREASPTGGALGQVAVQELEGLQSTIASLDIGQDRQTLENNLRQVEDHYLGWMAASAPDRLRELGYVQAPNGAFVKITN